MAARFENFALQELVAKPEDAFRLASLAMAQGQRVSGYRGDYYRCDLGDAVVIVRTVPDGEGEELLGMDTHVLSSCEWEISDWFDCPPGEEDADVLCRRIAFRDREGRTVPIEVVDADVLTWRTGKPLRLNMAAFSSWVVYGDNPLPAGEIPAGMVRLTGTVKDPKVGETYLGPEPLTKFLSVTVETAWGDVELCHSLEAVAEEQKDLVRPGCKVTALCTLSGDAATGEYAGGALYSEDKALELLHGFFLSGGERGLGNLLRRDAAATFLQNTQEGWENAHSLLEAVARELTEAGLNFPRDAVLSEVEAGEGTPNGWYPGKCCLLLGDASGERPAFLCLVDCDSLGRVRTVWVVNDGRLEFRLLPQG